ncbi:MAG: pyridoxamine 5'-phosphate oxidase family protein [Alphaproteobacteria bacterium]|nr:pyridoxamine 5'-phosphate oxidase family protein [Alphaproteobacteria bacterium]
MRAALPPRLDDGQDRPHCRGMINDPAPLGHRQAIRRLMRGCDRAALATLMADGAPYASLVAVATDHGGAPLLLLSQLSEHSRNLAADARVSLLFEARSGAANPQEDPRVTVTGRVARSDDPAHRARFLARHPAAAAYAGFGDFAFHRVEVERAHWVGGFARAVWIDDPLRGLAEPAARIAEAEPDILSTFDAGDWRLVAVDPDGCDLAQGETVRRVAFDRMVETPDDLRHALSQGVAPKG